MKHLYILRHAKSSWAQPGLGDVERPLNNRGVKQTNNLQAWLKANNISPDNVLCSPSERTRETHQRIEAGLNGAPLEIVPSLYNGMVDHYLEALWGQQGDAILLIGHNPTCDELTRYLTKPESPAAEKLMAHHFGTATLAIFEIDISDWSVLAQASGRLMELLRPRDLENTNSDQGQDPQM